MKKNVLMVGPVPPPYGGIAAVVEEIVNSDLKNEYSFEVFDSHEDAPSGFNILKRLPFNIRRFIKFNRVISQKKFEFAHLHFDIGSFRGKTLLILTLRLRGVKVLLHLHGTGWDAFYDNVSGSKKFFARTGIRFSNITIVLYDYWVRKIREILPEAQVYVTSNFVQEAKPVSQERVAEFRKRFNFSEDNIVVIFVGLLGWRKGCFDMLKAMPEVLKQRPRVRFVLVGGDDYLGEFDSIKQQVIDQGLSDRIFITGQAEREDVPVYMKMSQIFLLPTYREGAPIAIIEAMRSSLPIITTPVGGIPDMVEDDYNGLMIQPGNPEQMASAVIRLVDDPDLRERLGSTALKVFNEKFSSAKAIGQLAGIYKKMEKA